MKILKDSVRTYVPPESSIIEGYHMFDTLGYPTKYMQHLEGTACCMWDDKEENTMNDEIVQGNRWPRCMSANLGNGLTTL
jgi:hypothetical protein